MKTLPVLSILAALAASLLALPLGFENTVSVLFASGLVGLLIADYAHVIWPRQRRLAPAASTTERRENLRLAA